MKLDPHPAPAADMLADAITYVGSHLMRPDTIGERLRTLWAGVRAASGLAAADVVEDEFLKLAHTVGLAAELGRKADDDLRHVIRWAMLGMSPFQ